MKLISHIYEQYQIMPSLQLHMYRVAAVASLIVDHIEQPLERSHIISACLLHDMANIIKSDLTRFPDFVQPAGIDFWQSVKDDFIKRYGTDEYQATYQILEEIGVSQRTVELIKAMNYLYVINKYPSMDLATKICNYADFRVAPPGITSLEERWQDLVERYQSLNTDPEAQTQQQRQKEIRTRIEQDIFTQSTLTPEQITEASAVDAIASLVNFVVV